MCLAKTTMMSGCVSATGPIMVHRMILEPEFLVVILITSNQKQMEKGNY